MNEINSPGATAENTLDQLAGRATTIADATLSSARRTANAALDKLQEGVNELRQDPPGALARAAAQVEDMTRKSIERARQTSQDMRSSVERTGERTVSYIQDEPVKAVLIAAAAGAALAALIAVLARSHSASR